MISLLCGIIALSVSAQMNAAEVDFVRALLDSSGNPEVTVESVAHFDTNGRIVSLDLHNKDNTKSGLKALPPEIGKLTQLTSLILGNNSISSLPEEIGQLTLLKNLDLKYNNLS
jgi:hypothetical protein